MTPAAPIGPGAKGPVVEHPDGLLVGFSEAEWETAF